MKANPSIVRCGRCLIALDVIFSVLWIMSSAFAEPTVDHPLEIDKTKKEVRMFGAIYPARFNAAQGEEARYHLLVWKGGTSPNALIETPVDDLAFHAALESLGAQAGDNLTMASWNKRHDADSPEPKMKVAGSPLDVLLSWNTKPLGMPIAQAFRAGQESVPDSVRQSLLLNSWSPVFSPEFRFGGNRDRWFNRVPLAPRPGCLMCLYSCPSGKVGNRALSVHDYVAVPFRFLADTATLPPDGESVIIIVKLRQAS